ncbi:MAG: DEAD/DEAH box helicase [Candidatus Paceibacterota bacterium]|jgi:hypothetical protein
MIHTKLMPHQAATLEVFGYKPKVALFWKMGTGKSLTALMWAALHTCEGRLLITSDKNNVLNNWPDQIARHTDWYDSATVLVRPTAKQLQSMEAPCVVITNYDSLRTMWKEYKAAGFYVWIGDESSEFKDMRTDKAQALERVVTGIPFKIILNGDPMTERLEDLFGQFKILDGGASLGTSLTKFRSRYMQPDPSGYGWCARRNSYTDIQRAIKDCSHWLTDADKIVMPTVERWHVEVDMQEQQQAVDNQLKGEFAATLNGSNIEVKHAVALFVKRIQLAGGIFHPTDGTPPSAMPTNKLNVLLRVAKDNPHSTIVVWHTYVAETELMRSWPWAGRKVYQYVDPEDASGLEAFAKSENGVLLIRNSLCKGINQLTNVDISVFYSNPLSYRNRIQAEGRACRMTTENPVTHIIDITTKGGADAIVYNMLSQKRDTSLTLTGLRKYVMVA